MASYRGHLAFSTTLGVAYGAAGVNPGGIEPATAVVGAGVCALAGLLPDLDSDSGVPVRELFGVTAAVVPLLVFCRLSHAGLSNEELILILACIYGLIRYGFSRLFKWWTVHRGMWHSIPAVLICGLLTFLVYDNTSLQGRVFIAGAAALGFLSHLVLDEWSSVDFRGLRPKLNKYAGSAVKFASPSMMGTAVCYFILGGVLYLVWVDLGFRFGQSPIQFVINSR